MSAVFPLTPVQEAMLYHHLGGAEAGVDVEQIAFTLHEAFDANAFRAAWNQVMQRHEVLRTSFRWQGLERPMQCVEDEARIAWTEQDWRASSKDEQEQQQKVFLQEDRKLGFVLSSAPPMRMAIFRMTDTQWWVVWTFHHILLDGRSILLVIKEAFEVYEAALEKRDPTLAPVGHFRDHIRFIETLDWQRGESFWRRALDPITSPTPIPFPAPLHASSILTGHGEVVRKIDARHVLEAESLAQSCGVTLNTVVQALWALLLSRYSGEQHVLFGVTRACRKTGVEDSDHIVGMLINTLPMSVDANPNQTVQTFLAQVRKTWMDMREWEHTPISKIQEWSRISRSQRIVDSLVVFENYDLPTALRSTSPSWQRREIHQYEQSDFQVSLAAYKSDGLVLKIEYDQKKFSEETIGRVLRQFETGFLHLSSRDQWVRDIDFLPDEERQQLLVDWNQTDAPFPGHTCLHELICQAAVRFPNAIAASHENISLTYSELVQRAHQLARALHRAGVAHGDRVGVLLPRGNMLLVSLLGVLETGASYVPMDAAVAKERIGFMVKDADLKVVITIESFASLLDSSNARAFFIEPEWNTISNEDISPLPTLNTANDVAYVIYTSGSTGVPKGVLVPHRAVVNHVTATALLMNLSEHDRVVQFASPSFDVAVEEIFPTWSVGATLVTRPENVLSSLAFLRWLEQERITVLQLPTAFWHDWVRAIDGLGVSMPPTLRLVVVGGEKALGSVYSTWKKIAKDQVRWMNGYGPTETTVTATVFDDARDAWDGSDPSLGKPIANVRTFVLDPARRLVPIGVAGELWIGGAGVALGYLNRPEQTEPRFVEMDIGESGAQRLYRTGDRVRWKSDGTLEFLGRVDHQVKLRGFRIELGEIETVLRQHPDVKDAAVVLQTKDVESQLTAFVVSRSGQSMDPLIYRDFLRAHLPEYMVPQAYSTLGELPHTPNGKIDRDALGKRSVTALLTHAYEAPRDPIEELLVKIWSAAFRVPSVGIRDNFFELGGHSLLTLKIIDQAMQAGLRIRPEQLFQHQTIAELAEMVKSKPAVDGNEATLVALRETGTHAPLFLVHATPGDLFGYLDLVRALGPDQPCYGFQSLGLFQKELAHTDIKTMAAHYVGQLRAFHPHGPYCLGGWCYGGIVAVEIARQLLADGQRVAFVGVIDAWPAYPEMTEYAYYVDRARAYARSLRSHPLQFPLQKARNFIKNRFNATRIEEALVYEVAKGPLANRKHVYECNMRAVHAHRTTSFRGPLHVFHSATQEEGTVLDPNLGWSALAAEVISHPIPGDHRSVLKEPNVQRLAESMRAELAKVR